MTLADKLPRIDIERAKSYRLVNSKFPPIELFDDVAAAAEFALLYQLQALTNPRLQSEVGDLNLVTQDEIPFGISGCAYAIAPFTHVNPAGSRFSAGAFGVLYVADRVETAIREVYHHQEKYWQGVSGLNYDRFVFRALTCRFAAPAMHDATTLPPTHPIYHPDDYTASRALGQTLRAARASGIQYHSVRNTDAVCWGLFTPRVVKSMVQNAHYELVWDGRRIASVNRLTLLR